MSHISPWQQRLLSSLPFRVTGQALATPAPRLALPSDDPAATVPSTPISSGSVPICAMPGKGDLLPESVLLHHLYTMTETKPFVRAIMAGLEEMLHESDGRIGFQTSLGRQLHLPLQILVERPQVPNLEPLATLHAGIAGNLIYRSCAEQISTPACRASDARAVLGSLRRQACQLHLL